MIKILEFSQKASEQFPEDSNLCLAIKERQKPLLVDLDDDELILRVLYVSIDPVMRVWFSGATTYFSALRSGDTAHCFGIGQVIETKNNSFQKGDIVFGNTGIQQFAHIKHNRLPFLIQIKKNPGFPIHQYLNFLNNGMVAYYGLYEVCQPKQGETVVVSTAAGATGMFVCQLALHRGCRVIGITGSDEKCQFLKKELGVHETINYQQFVGANAFFGELQKACPKGIDVYFDNVGQDTLDDVLRIINKFGRIALCGAMKSYSNFNEKSGIKNYHVMISKQVMMKGVTFVEIAPQFKQAMEFYISNVQNKSIKITDTVFEGIESVYEALDYCFQGKNTGKVILQLDKEIPKPQL